MAESKIEKRPLLSAASGWNDAYAKAQSKIVVVGKAVVGGDNLAMTIEIPKHAVDTNVTRYWAVSDGYGGGGHVHMQITLNNGSLLSAAIYDTSGTLAQPQAITYYYD